MNRVDGTRPDAPPLGGYGAFVPGVRTVTLEVQPDGAATAFAPPWGGERSLTAEFWYPAAAGAPPGSTYASILRDGRTPVLYHGRASRGADPAEGRAPFVILSHGYPGNRHLMAHFGETLASRGFAVLAPDHAGSTYDDKGAFGLTLVHRPRDIAAAIAWAGADPFAARVADCTRSAVIGYSMGAYGTMIAAGCGLSDAALAYAPDTPRALLEAHAAGADGLGALCGTHVRAVVPIGLWGAQHAFWDAAGLAGLKVPALFIGGSGDAISGYETGIRHAFLGASGAARHLLTFEGAGHNAAAPIPAPRESHAAVPWLEFVPFAHYADPVWDTLRMNGIAQHLAAAFLSRHLSGDTGMERWLSPAPPVGLPALPPEDFPALRFETLPRGG